jgi:DNA-binding MarR family transcriptional regulator
MTRGRCDWLSLHRATLAFATPHRFIPELVAALPSAKGNISHSLRRLETQGLIVMLRTPGGKTESVYLTAAGRQKALKLTGSYE